MTLKRTSGRTSAASSPSLVAISTTSCTASHARHDLHDARIDARASRGRRARARRPSRRRRAAGARIHRQVQLVAGLVGCQACTRRSPPCTAIARAAREASSSAGQHDLVRIGEAGLLAGERTHADALLDAGAAVLDDAVLERPGLLVRELEVQVGEVHRVARAPRRTPGRGADHRGRSGCRISSRARCSGIGSSGTVTHELGSFASANTRCDERREALAHLGLACEIDLRDRRSRGRAARAAGSGPSNRRSCCRRRSRGRSGESRTARARSHNRDSRSRARAAASPSARARSAP